MTSEQHDDFPKFPHLENLDRVQQVLQSPRVWITEKIDGFNARFGVTLDGMVWAGTRNRTIDLDSEPTQGFAEFVRGAHLLGPAAPVLRGETFYGEWAGKGIQKRIDYGEPAFYLFAVRRQDRSWATPEEVLQAAALLGIRHVPDLHDGPPPPIDVLDGLRHGKSILAPDDDREGIVIWPHPVIVDPWGHQIIAKFKNPAFEERASKRRAEQPISVDFTKVLAFVHEYVTEERLGHVLQHVYDENGWSDSPLDVRHTGDVLRAMYQDIVREGAADYAALSEDDQKLVGKVSARETKVLLDAARLKGLVAA